MVTVLAGTDNALQLISETDSVVEVLHPVHRLMHEEVPVPEPKRFGIVDLWNIHNMKRRSGVDRRRG